jgi:uncharacterized protein YcbX
MYKLVDIFIYPIKSLGKVPLEQSDAQIRGFQFDRRMMLTDAIGNFLSQRQYPEMAKFKVSLVENGFLVNYESDELFIPFDLQTSKLRSIKIWEDQLTAPEADPQFSNWFSDHLNAKYRLIIMNDQTIRSVDKKYSVYDETVSFSDGFPYLLIGSASLDDLNEQLDIPVPMDRFRPNLVIQTDMPFVEDSFDIFKIGNAIFKRSKPCARCIVTTTDQLTGIREKEPLLTLSGYRKVDNKILFGQNVICLKEGSVKVGDEVISGFSYQDLLYQ